MLNNTHESDLGEFDVFALDADVAPLIVRSVGVAIFVFTLELRESDLGIAKEILISCLQIQLRIGKGERVYFPKPLKFALVLCGCVIKFLLVFFIIGDLVPQHLVPNEASAAEGLGKHLALGLIWIQPEFICPVRYAHLALLYICESLQLERRPC